MSTLEPNPSIRVQRTSQCRSRRVHAELRLGLNIHVSHGTVELLMQRVGLHGLPGNRRSRAKHVTPSVTDLVERPGHGHRQPLPRPGGTIIHSDHGVQFGSWAFTQRARASGLLPSMGSIGDCVDNAMMESPDLGGLELLGFRLPAGGGVRTPPG